MNPKRPAAVAGGSAGRGRRQTLPPLPPGPVVGERRPLRIPALPSAPGGRGRFYYPGVGGTAGNMAVARGTFDKTGLPGDAVIRPATNVMATAHQSRPTRRSPAYDPSITGEIKWQVPEWWTTPATLRARRPRHETGGVGTPPTALVVAKGGLVFQMTKANKVPARYDEDTGQGCCGEGPVGRFPSIGIPTMYESKGTAVPGRHVSGRRRAPSRAPAGAGTWGRPREPNGYIAFALPAK